MALTLENIEHCYKSLIKNPKMGAVQYGRHFGYLEAGLKQFDYLETEMVGSESRIKVMTVKGDKWWQRQREETLEEAIIRMVRKLLSDNGFDT